MREVTAGAALGALIGLIVGLATSEVVGSVIAALIALLAVFFGLQGGHRPPASGRATSHRRLLCRGNLGGAGRYRHPGYRRLLPEP